MALNSATIIGDPVSLAAPAAIKCESGQRLHHPHSHVGSCPLRARNFVRRWDNPYLSLLATPGVPNMRKLTSFRNLISYGSRPDFVASDVPVGMEVRGRASGN
jgi:hypothetical protein